MLIKKLSGLFSAVLALTLGVSAASVSAQTKSGAPAKPNGYLQSSSGTVKSGFGVCVGTGYFTPDMQTPECAAAAVSLRGDSLFDFNSAVLKREGRALLDTIAKKAKAVKAQKITVVGHTDSMGTDAYNQKLSERRAAAVKNYLVSKGISAKTIVASGKGESSPVASNSTEEGRAKNRRVEVDIQ